MAVVINTKTDLKNALAHERKTNPGVITGLVPTMGALHKGHASLIKKSAEECGITVVSIFVNPIQFDDAADLATYPSTPAADIAVCEQSGADYIFAPSAAEMYPTGFSTHVTMEGPTDVLCGASRGGHFTGVLTVVSKLFGITQADKAYFGEKDAQQLFVIKKMAKDLDMKAEVIGCETVRDADGLATSSRNAKLTPEERKAALCIPKALKEGTPEAIIKEPLAKLDYYEKLDADTFGPVTKETKNVLTAAAAHIGKTRLIDNMVTKC